MVFRLTQDEYRALQEACRARGGRNLSDFTRSELLSLIRSDTWSTLQDHIQRLDEKLTGFEASLDRMYQVLAAEMNWEDGSAAPRESAGQTGTTEICNRRTP